MLVEKHLLDIRIHLETKQRLSKGTCITRISRIKVFLAWVKDNNKPIVTNSIEEFLYFLKQERGLVNASLNTYVTSLSSLEKYLVDKGIAEPFMQGVRTFKEDEVLIESLTEEECKLLLFCPYTHKNKTLERSYRALTMFLLLTGARFEDGQALVVSSIDVTSKKITYKQLKTKRNRFVYITDGLLTVLQQLMVDKTEKDLVFTNTVGGRVFYPDYYQYLKALTSHAGIKKRVSPHVLRHSYSQVFYDSTGDIFLLKDILGHSQITSTQRYIYNSQERLKTAQMKHPFLRKDTDPKETLKQIGDTIKKMNLDKDEKVTYEIVEDGNSLSFKVTIK